MSERVVLICLDSAEPELIDAWADAGELPTLARIRREAAGYVLDNRLELLPDSIWSEVNTGRSVGRSGDWSPLGKIHSGEATARPLDRAAVAARSTYWRLADAAGRRVTVIDAIESALCDDFNGFHLQQWGLHTPIFGSGSIPPEAYAETCERFGEYPAKEACDDYGFSLPGHAQLLRDLLLGQQRKCALAVDRLQRDDWDLFSVSFSETHCAGHQLWYLHDTTHPLHPADAPEGLRNSLREIYRGMDRSLGALLDAVPEDAMVLVLASHGMRNLVGAEETLPELLEKLGLGRGKQLRLKLGLAVPQPLKRGVRKLLGQATLDRYQLGLNSRRDGFDGTRAPVIAVSNFRIGAMRLNLRGREPEGCVAPGEEARALLDRIETELRALRDPRSAEPVVEAVVRCDDAFGADRHPDLPDLFIRFRHDLGPLDCVHSDRVGTLRRPQPSPRTGDHTDHSRLWILGPRARASAGELGRADCLDILPTLLEALEVPLPEDLDGSPIALG